MPEKIVHTAAAVPHAVTTTDSILVLVLNELIAIHEHFDAQEDAAIEAETLKKTAAETATKRPPKQ